MNKAHWLVVIQFVLFGLMLLSISMLPSRDSTIIRIIGAVLFVIGVGVLLWGTLMFTQINRKLPNISPQPTQAAQLVQTGIYAHIRHPLYSAVILCGFGVALLHGHIVSVLMAFVLYGFFSYKSRYEELLLMATYPEYAAYMTRTGRFMPFIQW